VEPIDPPQAPEKATSHRALDDIRESIAELAYYREHLFVPAERVAADEGSDTAPA
jgi:oligoribonuclease